MAVAWSYLLSGGKYNSLGHGWGYLGSGVSRNKPSAQYDAFFGGSNVY